MQLILDCVTIQINSSKRSQESQTEVAMREFKLQFYDY